MLVTGGTQPNINSEADAALPVELWQPGNKLNPNGPWTMNAVLDAPDILAPMKITAPPWRPDATAENHFGLLPLE